MKTYKVTITEVLRRTIEVEAETSDDAIDMVEEGYRAEEYVLDYSDFVNVEFKIENPNESAN